MQIYNGGLIVHQAFSDEGVIEVVDYGDSRSLHFGTYPRQSSMSLRTPHTLELSYTQAMMACILLNPSPKRVLVVGLGGGSLVKFLLHHYPCCEVEVVEYRQDVIDVATSFFAVPDRESRLKIHVGDGYLFVNQRLMAGNDSYDLVLVDAYDHEGMAIEVGGQSFFDACAGLLTSRGVFSINLWGTERALFHQTLDRINQSFNKQTMQLPVENKGNVIVLATQQASGQYELKKMRGYAEQLDQRLQINLPKLLHKLIRQNRSFISRWLAG